jgi:hypothetical protein
VLVVHCGVDPCWILVLPDVLLRLVVALRLFLWWCA